MAVSLGGILESTPFSDKRAPCGGQNFLSQKVGGRISVRVCSSASNNNDGSVHSCSKNVGKKETRREDVMLPSYTEKGSTMRWWLPLFGWSQADQERWVDDESKTKSMNKSSDDVEKEMGEAPLKRSKFVDDVEKEMGEAPLKRSKFVRGPFTAKKAKLLRKNLRDTSTFHDVMYHSAIASRLASPDNEG